MGREQERETFSAEDRATQDERPAGRAGAGAQRMAEEKKKSDSKEKKVDPPHGRAAGRGGER